MIRWLLLTFTGIVLGGIVHLATVLYLPRTATNDAYSRLASNAPINTMMALPQPSPAAAVVPYMDPAFASAVCRYDLSKGPIKLSAPVSQAYTSVSFYERFVAGTAPRHGLGVQALQLRNEGGRAWHFTATLTQTATRDAPNRGTLTLAVEGSRGGRMQRLDWAALRQQPAAPGIDYAFKYFQQVEGDLLLPQGLQPIRVTVRLQPERGEAVEQSFTWRDAAAAPAADGHR